MILHIATISPDQQNRDFTYHLDDPEQGYDFLLNVKKSGHAFLKVEFVDDRNYYSLSVDALNQAQAVNPFHQLKQQWEECLTYSTINQRSLRELNNRLLGSQQALLANLKETLDQTLTLLESTQIYLCDGPRKIKLIQQCWLTIDRCNRPINYYKSSPWQLRSVKAAR